MKRLILVAVTLGLSITAISLNAQRNDKAKLKAVDQLLIAELEGEISRHLSELKPDDPISRRYGKFIELKGAGIRRDRAFKGGTYGTMDRVAVFEKAHVEGQIRVYGRRPFSIRLYMIPSAEWIDNDPDATLVKSGDFFVLQLPGSRAPTALEISTTHPRFFTSAADLQRFEELNQSADNVVSDLAAGISKQNAKRLEATRLWYQSQRETKPIDLFLRKAFSHPDRRVRVEAAKLLSVPSPGYGKVLHAESTVDLLLDTVEDRTQDKKLKLEIVSAIMLNYEDRRDLLYHRLRQMGVEGHFAIPVLASFLNDPTARHQAVGGAFDAPTGAVELLGDWGPDAVDAVPDLVAAMEQHPNQWALAPAAAEALGKMGPPAKAAIPALIRASVSPRGNVRSAAIAALEKIHVGGELPKNHDIAADPASLTVGYSSMRKPNYFFWLAEDGQHVLSIVSSADASGLFAVDLQNKRYRQLAELPTDGLVDVHPTKDIVHLLRMTSSDDGYQVEVDRWSLESQRPLASVKLVLFPPVPQGQRLRLEDVVWHKAAGKLAFRRSISKPVKGKPKTSAVSRRLYLFDLDSGDSLIPEKVTEYLLAPISFSDHQEKLYLYGHSVANQKTCMATMDLESYQVQPIAGSAIPGYHAVSVNGDLVLYQGRGSSQPPMKLFNIRTGRTLDLQLSDGAARYGRPFKVAFDFVAGNASVCIVTESSIDIFDTTSGEMMQQIGIFQPNGSLRILPIMVDTTSDQVVLLASNSGATISKTGWWMRRATLDREKLNQHDRVQE